MLFTDKVPEGIRRGQAIGGGGGPQDQRQPRGGLLERDEGNLRPS